MRVGTVAIVVDEYDAAIAFYCGALGLQLLEDTRLPDGKRWVVVAGQGGAGLLLARAADDRQRAAIGNQTGGRVGFFLETDDFERDYARLGDAGVNFIESPRHESYGSVVVFADPYGNKWDLIQRKP